MICAYCGSATCADHDCIVCIARPVGCEVHLLADAPQQCSDAAFWRLNGFAHCDECLLTHAEQLPDNREWFAQVLEDISCRQSQDARQLLDIFECRYQFVALMRRPELRLLRLALAYLREAGADWRQIQEMEIELYSDHWYLQTPEYFVLCIDSARAEYTEDFEYYYRCTGLPDCRCMYCE
jgi:hypothetical protein